MLSRPKGSVGYKPKVTEPTYVILNEQVELVACYKPDLIDLEAYGVSYGDRAQASESWAA